MESQNSEVERSKNETVQVDEIFSLFNPVRTHSWPDQFGVRSFSSEITLASDVLPPFSLSIKSTPFDDPRYDVITPFNPEQGYQIDQRDANYETRKAKLLDAEWQGFIHSEQNPLCLRVENDGDTELQAAGLIMPAVKKTINHRYRWEDDALKDLSRLRLQLFIETATEKETEKSRLSLEARPYFSEAGFRFYEFYPLETGPLPASDDGAEDFINHARPGLYLTVPSDIEKLGTIKAKFVFAKPPKPKE